MDIFDEIIETLRMEQGNSEYAYISPDIIKEFYSYSKPIQENIGKQKPLMNRRQNTYNRNVAGNINNYIQQQKIQSEPLTTREYGEVPGKNQNVAQADYGQIDMEQLKGIVTDCAKCKLCRTRTNTVFGEGSYNAELMLIGEGPGRDEDLQGRPFVGRSGQLLTKMLNAMGYDRNEVFIGNIVKCRPPNNRNPHPEEADACIGYLIRQIEIIKPKVLILLGAVPMKFILNKTGITRIHGQWFEFRGIKTLPTFHPSFLLRDPRQKKYAWEDLQKVMKVLGKTYVKR